MADGGECGVDYQTVLGKTPLGVATIAKKLNILTILFVDRIGEGAEKLYEHGVISIISMLPGIVYLEGALKDGTKNMDRISKDIARILKL